MNTVQRHYETLLGEVYAWSRSSRGEPFTEAETWLREHRLEDARTVLDLGAGFGLHAVPLARRGAQVTAVDFDPTLLQQLRGLSRGLPVVVREADLRSVLREGRDFELTLCAGDTLAHLSTLDEVKDLLHLARGRLALQYRDTSAVDLTGAQRFIEVAADARRTMHCLLEVLDAEHLRVTDLVTDLTRVGPRTRISDYVKLRLSAERIATWAADAGRVLERSSSHCGVITQVFSTRAFDRSR